MTQDAVGLDDYVPAPAGQLVEGASGILLPMAVCGCLYLLADQGIGNAKVPTRELAFKRVECVPNLGRHNLLSVKRLAQSFDAPMRFTSPTP